MTAQSIQPTYPIFTDVDGQPLENGFVWVGQANLDPQVNPIAVFWDAALTIPAVQPIRTLAGYPSNSGAPGRLYVNSDYSIRVMSKNGSTVYSAPVATERFSADAISGISAGKVGYSPPFTGSIPTAVEGRLAQYPSVRDFGAVGDGVTDDTAPIQASISAVGYAYLPEGSWYVADPVVDTALIRGPGLLRADTTSGRQMLPEFRKDYTNPNKVRFTFEDEYGAHQTTAFGDLYYTGFGSACFCSGFEIYAARVGRSHESNFLYPTSVALYFYSGEASPAVTKQVIYTTTVNEDIRDVNITAHPTRNNIVLIKFAEFSSGGSYQTRLITFNAQTRKVESNRLISGPGASDFTWGNSLITPQGFLLFCTYRTTGGVDIWRTTAQLPVSGAISATIVASFEVDAGVSEPTIGYWGNRLVLVHRREGAAGYLYFSYDQETAAGWSAPVFPTGGVIHSPCLIPYNNSSVFSFTCSLGTNRALLSFASSTDLVKYKVFSTIEVAGAEGAIGGYPSFVDLGGSYAISTYSDMYSATSATRRSRFERMEVDKKRIDIGVGDFNYIRVLDLENSSISGVVGLISGNIFANGARTTSDGRNYSTEFLVNRAININAVYFLLNGTSTITAEVYEDGVLVATSASVSITTTQAAPVEFTFGSNVPLSLYRRYNVKLTATAAFSIYDARHNTRRGGAVIKLPDFTVDNTKSGGGASIASTSLIVPAIRVVP